MDDRVLKDLIEDELEWEPSVDAADIGVAVEDGVVTLMGHVTSFAEKLGAEDAAKRVKGVRAIAQEIEVRIAGREKTADDEIAVRAANVLDWDVAVPKDTVQIKVQKGYVTLSGDVEWRYQADQARYRVASLPGVMGVSSLIKVKPRASAGDIKDRIEQALKRSAEIEADRIQINVEGGKVTLEGKIDAWRDREVAERAAWSAPGVSAVDDRLHL